MKIAGKHFNKRAVSQIIAALLLVAIAVAAAILVYVFSIGLLGSLQSSGGQQTKQQVIMEAYNWLGSPTPNPLVMTLRNVGPANVEFADVFVNGIVQTPAGSGCMAGTPPTLAVGSSCVMTITTVSGFTISSGVAYTAKIVTKDGAVFSYAVIAGQAT